VARTYLQLVNDVLIRLRESAVVTNGASSYSSMVGAFINDAKREVEDAWQWSHLMDWFIVPVVQGQYSYETNSFITRSLRPLSDRTRLWIDTYRNVPLLINTTKNFENLLTYEPSLENIVTHQVTVNNAVNDIPQWWQLLQSASTPTAGAWNKTLLLYNIPNNSYTLNGMVVNPQTDLVNDTDTLLVPYAPVVQKAYLYCLYERGEELGETITLTQQKVETTLVDAISQDQSISAQGQQVAIPFGGQY